MNLRSEEGSFKSETARSVVVGEADEARRQPGSGSNAHAAAGCGRHRLQVEGEAARHRPRRRLGRRIDTASFAPYVPPLARDPG
jgi:hypothetical protein